MVTLGRFHCLVRRALENAYVLELVLLEGACIAAASRGNTRLTLRPNAQHSPPKVRTGLAQSGFTKHVECGDAAIFPN